MQALGEAIHHWRLADGTEIGVRRFELAPFLETTAAGLEGPVLHVGSKAGVLDRETRWRAMFAGRTFVGADMTPGDNVDAVFDVTGSIAKLRKATGIHQFATILCPHVLEHVTDPFAAARNLARLLTPGGRLLVTVPWVQGFHEFPDDYWRISFSGLRQLFPGLAPEHEFYSNAAEDTGYQLTRNGAVEHSVETCRIERNLFQFLLDAPPPQPMFDDAAGDKIALSRQFMPAMSVNLIGVKAAGRTSA